MDNIKSIKPEKSLSSVWHRPIVYNNVDDILAANEKWKAEQIVKNRDSLNFLNSAYSELEVYYNQSLEKNPNDPEVVKLGKRLLKLKGKIIKFEQLINDYEKRDW